MSRLLTSALVAAALLITGIAPAATGPAHAAPEAQITSVISARVNPSAPTTGFGFLVPLPGGRPGQTLDTFKKDVDGLAAAGQTWLRTGLPNWLLAPTGSASSVRFDAAQVAALNTALDYARSKGLKTFVYVGMPDWAGGFSHADYAAATKLYWGGLASRVGQRIDVWQLFNEADTTSYQNYAPVSAEVDYLRRMRDLIASGRTAVRAHAPSARITTNLSGWPMNDAREAEWNRVLDVLAPALDVVSLDIYTGDNATEAFKLTARIDRIEARYRKQVAVAEFGLQTQGWTEQDQLTYMPAMVTAIKAAEPMAVIAYEYRDSGPGQEYQGFGIVRNDRSAKVATSTVLAAMQPQSRWPRRR